MRGWGFEGGECLLGNGEIVRTRSMGGSTSAIGGAEGSRGVGAWAKGREGCPVDFSWAADPYLGYYMPSPAICTLHEGVCEVPANWARGQSAAQSPNFTYAAQPREAR